MGPIASSADAYERGGHSLPGRSAVEPKGGVPDTFITFRNPPARDAVCAKWGLGYWSEKKGESARMRRNCENESRKPSKIWGLRFLCDHGIKDACSRMDSALSCYFSKCFRRHAILADSKVIA
jgi:hypothetical protein